VPLADVLTRAFLRARAGYGYERGERYWKQGRVSAYAARGDTVSGVVRGSEMYRVRLLVAGGHVEADCTCPVGVSGLFCKHAVALALHHLEAGEPARGRGAAGAAAVEGCFATRGELEAWAVQHRVAFELALAADVLVPELEHAHPSAWTLRRELCLLTLRELGSLEGVRRVFGGAQLQQLAAAAVARRLAQRADEVKAGLAEERTRSAALPAAVATGAS